MSKDKGKLIPKLRFPEFENDGEWDQKSLGETGTIVTGKTPSTKDESLWDGEILFITPTDIEENRKYQIETARTVVENEKLNALPIGSIAYTCIASIGKMAITTKASVTNQQINSIVVNKNHHNEFVYYSLLNITPHIKSRPATSTLPIINKTEFSRFKIAIPNPQEQQKIASCLSSLDELIAAHNDKLDSLKDHKKGLLQNLFPQEGDTSTGSAVPKVRFSEFEGDGGWVEKTFEQLFIIGSGKDYKHLEEGEIPVYGSGGYMLSVNDYLYDGESVCIGRKGTIDNPIFLTGKFWTVDTLFYTHGFNECIPKFIFYVFLNINWLNHNEAGGVPSLSKKNLYKIETAVPPTEKEQQKIASCLSAVDELITAETEKIEQLQQHKKGLMQALFPKSITN